MKGWGKESGGKNMGDSRAVEGQLLRGGVRRYSQLETYPL